MAKNANNEVQVRNSKGEVATVVCVWKWSKGQPKELLVKTASGLVDYWLVKDCTFVK